MDPSLQKLPEELINYPVFPLPNRMVLCPYDEPVEDRSEGSYCDVCLFYFEEGQYIYATCESEIYDDYYVVCIRCSSINARVAYFGHRHPMFFLEQRRPEDAIECSDCKAESAEAMFVCLVDDCDYNLHLRCGPLPTAIPFHYAGYDMTLTLTDALVEGVDAEDSWCDICEEQRDPNHPVYHSSDPLFTATTECVLPQIVRALQGHLGEVELRQCSTQVGGVVLVSTQSSTDDDAKEVIAEQRTKTQAAQAANNDYVILSEDQLGDSMTPEEGERRSRIINILAQLTRHPTDFKFSDKAFEQFKEHVSTPGEVDPDYFITYLTKNIVYAKVGSNFIALELVPMYRQMIDRHGDFTANSPLSPAGNSLFLFIMMKILRVLLVQRIFHLSANELCNWQWYFEYVRDELGFKVQFALDYLETAARCCHALKFIKVRDEITGDLSKQIEGLAKDVDDDKPKVEELLGLQKRAMEGSAFGKQCFYKTSKLQ